MNIFFSNCFEQKVSQLNYAWTWAEVNPSLGGIPERGIPNLLGSIAFATGVLELSEIKIHGMDLATKAPTTETGVTVRRYMDTKVELWGAEGVRVGPSSIVPPKAPYKDVDHLIVEPSGTGAIVTYGKRPNSGIPVYMDYHSFPNYPTFDKAVFFAPRLGQSHYYGMCLVLRWSV